MTTETTEATPDAPEERTVDVDVRDVDARGNTIVGYAAVYGSESSDLGGFTERIAAGAFADVLRTQPDVRALLNHDESQVLGRTRSGTLRLHDEQRGLRFELDLPDSPLGQNVREAVRRQDIDGASFRFKVGRDSWEGRTRTIEQVEHLADVTVATFGAYPAASIELRTRPTSADGQDHDRAEAQEDTNVNTDDRNEQGEQEQEQQEQQQDAGGGLATEQRTAQAETEQRTVTERVVTAMRSVNRGESRSLSVVGADAITPPEMSSFVIDRLRASAIALSSGIPVQSTDAASVVFPQITSDVDPTWVAAGELIPEGAPAIVALPAEPKKLAHRVEIDNEVLDDSDPSAQAILDQHLGTMLGLKLDRSVFEGNPASDSDSIRGLKFTTGIQEISMGTNGAVLADYDPFIRAVGMLRDANVVGPYVIATHGRTLTALELLRETADSKRQLPRPEGLPPFATSSQLSTNETQGTSTDCASAYVFAPGQLMVVDRQRTEVELDRSRLFHMDQSEMRAKLRVDLLVPNPAAVVRVKGIRPAA